MPEFIIWGLGGTLIGFCIGLTGVGGGSLMTPFLVYFGIPLPTAIGTDLMYATATKSGAVWSHHRQGTIRWDIVLLLASASIPCSIITALVIKTYVATSSEAYTLILKNSLGAMLLISASLLIARNPLVQFFNSNKQRKPLPVSVLRPITVLVGGIIGVLVTLSSVGAGLLGTSVLLFLYPRMPAVQIVGTELAHAVPLTLAAGTSYWLVLQSVDFLLLPVLLVGSLPGVWVGAQLSTKVPQHILRFILIFILAAMGLNLLFLY